MFGFLSLFKAGERPLKCFLNVLFHSLTHRMNLRSIKFGPNLDPKALNVHQLAAAYDRGFSPNASEWLVPLGSAALGGFITLFF